MDMRKYTTPLHTKGISDIRVREYTLENGEKQILSQCRSTSLPNIFIGWGYPKDNLYFNTFKEALDYCTDPKNKPISWSEINWLWNK